MFSMCSELTPRARIPDTRIPQFMQPWPAYSEAWCAKVHFTQFVKHEVAVMVMITTAMTTVLEW